MSDDGGGEETGGENEDVPLFEKAVMVVSVLFTLSLFGFAIWQSLTGASAVVPTADLTGSEETSDGVQYTVELRNEGDIGLVSATVEVGCTDPPTTLTFENVPAGGRRVGTVVCPPGTSDPTVSVVTWIQE